MRCDIAREMFEEDSEKQPGVQSHLASCVACAEYAREWELIRQGFAYLRGEQPPEPSVGFATRVVRHIERASQDAFSGSQFLLQAGRRMAMAGLLIVFLLMLVLILPSSGPVRSTGVSESVLSQPEVAALSSDQPVTDQLLGVDASDFSGAGSGRPSLQNAQGTK